MAQKGSALKGALARTPSQGLQRLSPGVYRNQQGQLVGSTGGALPGQRPQQPPFKAMPGRQRPSQLPQQPISRPPASLPQDRQGMYYAGGSPNFNEMTGQYNNPSLVAPYNQMQSGFGIGLGSAFGGQQEQMPQQQYNAGFGNYMQGRMAGMPPLSADQQAAELAQQQVPTQQPQQQMMMQPSMYKGPAY